MDISKNYHPIIIIGAGISGLSTAYHLNKFGFDKLKIISDPNVSQSHQLEGAYVIGGSWSNFTRISHARGFVDAANIWQFGDQAFDSVEEFCSNHPEVIWEKGQRMRLICSDHELQEAQLAVSQLSKTTSGVELCAPSKFSGLHNQRCLAVQVDGQRGAYVNAKTFLRALRSHVKQTIIEGKVVQINELANGVEIQLENGLRYMTEMLVVTAHHSIGDLIPNLKNAVIPVADQCLEIILETKTKQQESILSAGNFLSANHGYEWTVCHENQYISGGCRYLRRHGGVGDSFPRYLKNVEQKIIEQFMGIYQTRVKTFKTGYVGTDIYPCDELPLIGPMYGSSKILVATGYMGQGVSYGFYVGKCLTELALTGKSDHLPRIFWPERLRSL